MFLIKWLVKRYFVGYGPIMFKFRDGWYFIDRYGNWWEIRETAQYDNPIIISRYRKQ